MGVLVRPARLDDAGAVSALATVLVGFEAERQACVARLLVGPDHRLLVAEVGGGVAGFAHLLIYDDLTHGGPAGELLALIVDDRFRRQGIGSALLAEACRLAQESGAAELHINTETDNRVAQELYTRAGAGLVGVQLEIELQP